MPSIFIHPYIPVRWTPPIYDKKNRVAVPIEARDKSWSNHVVVILRVRALFVRRLSSPLRSTKERGWCSARSFHPHDDPCQQHHSAIEKGFHDDFQSIGTCAWCISGGIRVPHCDSNDSCALRSFHSTFVSFILVRSVCGIGFYLFLDMRVFLLLQMRDHIARVPFV